MPTALLRTLRALLLTDVEIETLRLRVSAAGATGGSRGAAADNGAAADSGAAADKGSHSARAASGSALDFVSLHNELRVLTTLRALVRAKLARLGRGAGASGGSAGASARGKAKKKASSSSSSSSTSPSSSSSWSSSAQSKPKSMQASSPKARDADDDKGEGDGDGDEEEAATGASAAAVDRDLAAEEAEADRERNVALALRKAMDEADAFLVRAAASAASGGPSFATHTQTHMQLSVLRAQQTARWSAFCAFTYRAAQRSIWLAALGFCTQRSVGQLSAA